MKPVLVRKMLILKGDGNYAFHNGQPHLLTAPPPEAINPDPNQPDLPPFAHHGNAFPHELGHPGMGAAIPGRFEKGKHGEYVYKDESGLNHHHGIDGVIHHLGEALERHGILGQQHPELGELTPKNLVQKAIDITNQRHQDTSGFHDIPDVESMEHRKIKIAGYTGREAANRPNRSVDEHYITGFTNRANRREKIGQFLESLSVPYNNALQEIVLNTLGLKDMANVEWLNNNYISIDDLHPAGRRLKGRGGDIIGEGFTLPDSHIKNAPAGVVHDAAHTGIQSWEVMHHTPNMMHMNVHSQSRPPKVTVNSARKHIEEALKIIDPEKIPDVEVPINTTPGTVGKPSYSMQPFRTVLRDPTMMDNLIGELSKTPAFQGLFGRINSGGDKNPGPGKRIFNHLLDEFGGDPDEEGGTQYRHLKTHAISGKHLVTSDGEVPTSGQGTHSNAALFFAKVMLLGPHEEGASAMRHYHPDDKTLQSLGLNLDSYQTVGERRQGNEALADLMSEAFGHQTRRPLPETIPKGALASRVVQGYPDQIINRLPEHVPFFADVALPPPQRQHQTEASPRPEPAPRTIPQPVAKLPQPTPPVAPSPSSTMGPVSGGPFHQQSPEVTAARQAVAGYSPEDLESFITHLGRGNVPTEQRERFQQTMGDPQQQFLTQYLRSEDADLLASDRLVKAMEDIQLDDARSDTKIMKHALPRPINIADEYGISHLAKNIGLTAMDVRSIVHSVGDWERIAKELKIQTDIIKVVKVSVGGI